MRPLTRRPRSFSILAVYCSLFSPVLALTVAPVQLIWSEQTYGPDGPWHAIKTHIGTKPRTQVDLLPASLWWTNILDADNCDGLSGSACIPREAGLYDPRQSASRQRVPVNPLSPPTWDINTPMKGTSRAWADDLSLGPESLIPKITNCSFLVDSHTTIELPGANPGEKFVQPTIGQLSLGAPQANQPVGGVVMNLPPNGLYLNGYTPSASFGMHVGSVAAGIPPSLWFGGYDRTKVLGNVASNTYYQARGGHTVFALDLSDVSAISTSEVSETGMLQKGNSSIDPSLSVSIAPWSSYMDLPKSVCDAMTANLPVHFEPALGYYLWDITDPSYELLVGSSSYFTFTFLTAATSSEAQNLEIKVPFKLLNLTLEAPIVQKPTAYFPCVPVTTGDYRLGRAFLQSAFFGVNWRESLSPTQDGRFFLAQAPGPNTPESPFMTTISEAAVRIASLDTEWEHTWKGHWNILEVPLSSTRALSTVSTTSSGLSTGAKAGIGVGVALVILLCVGVAAFVILRRRKQKRRSRSTSTFDDLDGATMSGSTTEGSPMREAKELDSENAAVEKYSHPIVEKDSSPVVEKDGQSARVEMPALATVPTSTLGMLGEKQDYSPELPSVNEKPVELP